MEAASFLCSDSGIKDTADSPTHSFYVGSRQNKTSFSAISKKSISLANQKNQKQYARRQPRTF